MDGLIGQKFGEWTVVSFDKKVKYQKYYNCKCSCGAERSVAKSNLVSNKSTSCGHIKRMPKNDLVGKRFGRLVVVSYVEHNPKEVTSRGCRWLCKCDCGNEIVTRTQNLTSQQVKSCGCLNNDMRKTIGRNNMEDLSGRQFGELTVLSNYPTNNQRAAWTCQCSCGEIVVVSAGHLKSGHTQSCGHIKSKGEERIAELLKQYSIPYQRQYTFDDLKSDAGYPLRFDFAILKDDEVQKLIEYQGKQHYGPIEYFGGKEAFDILIKNDTKLVCTMCFGLASCGKGVSYEDANTEQEDMFNGYFTVVKEWENGSGNFCRIIYANDTGVMYFYFSTGYGKGITPLYNADGTLQVYEGFSSVEEE